MSDRQAEVNRMFPDGLSVTIVNDVPEWTDESAQFHMTNLRVIQEEPLVLWGVAVELHKDYYVKVMKWEETSPGCWLVTTPDDHPDLILSANLGTLAPVIRAIKDANEAVES